MKTSEIIEKLQARKDRSAWDSGVTQYAIEIVEHCGKEELDGKDYYEALLNGAEDWRAYSFGACSLICDEDICRRLYSPSMQKRYRYGEKEPSNIDTWLDVQTLALRRACRRVRATIAGWC